MADNLRLSVRGIAAVRGGRGVRGVRRARPAEKALSEDGDVAAAHFCGTFGGLPPTRCRDWHMARRLAGRRRRPRGGICRRPRCGRERHRAESGAARTLGGGAAVFGGISRRDPDPLGRSGKPREHHRGGMHVPLAHGARRRPCTAAQGGKCREYGGEYRLLP